MKKKIVKEYLKGFNPKYYSRIVLNFNWEKYINEQLNKIKKTLI